MITRFPRTPQLAVLAVCLMCTSAVAESWSLHVGVNKYPNLKGKDLQGCVNDAFLMRNTLINQYGFPEDNTVVLTDERATASNIVAVFESHLIGNSQPGDSVVFSFSGHGTQIPDKEGDEDDNLDESLCATDIGMNRDREIVNAVTDDMLRELCARLADRHVLVILDCCHSGTGTRSLFAQGRSRFLSPYDFDVEASPKPVSLLDAPLMNTQSIATEESHNFTAENAASTRSLGNTAGSLSFLSACKANELAQESVFTVGEKPQPHGAFTTKLVRGMSELGGSRGAMTYGDLESWLHGPLVTAERAQHPQVEIPEDLRSRVLFGFGTPDSTPQPALPTQSAEPFEGIKRVRVFLTHASVFTEENPSDDAQLRNLLQGHLKTLPIVELVDTRDSANATVFYANDGGNNIAGVLLPSGEISKRFQLSDLTASRLKPLDTELNRVYLVNGMTNLRNPGRDRDLSIRLLNDKTNLRDGDPVGFSITSQMSGHLTLVNITSEGGWLNIDPSWVGLPKQINAGQTITFPPNEGDIFVEAPYGEEMLKVLVTKEPLDLPETIEPEFAAEMISTRALGVRSRSETVQQRNGLDSLSAENFAEASVRYRTYPK